MAITTKADNSFNIKDALQISYTNVGLIIKHSSVAMQSKRKLCECHIKIFNRLYKGGGYTVRLSI